MEPVSLPGAAIPHMVRALDFRQQSLGCHRRAIELGIRALVITSNLELEADTVELARRKGVSIIVSPYDSATTAWVVRTASSIERVIEREIEVVDSDARISDVRKRFSLTTHALMVTNDDGDLTGIITKSDIFKPVKTRLALVEIGRAHV